MCGLVVLIRQQDAATATRAIEAMQHRGTVPPVVEIVGPHTFAHVRLPIVDLTDHARQPFHVGDDTVMLTGEIHNFKSMSPGASSDTEVFANRLAHEGLSWLHQADGFWAGAHYSPDCGLAVFNDFLSIKPLYYSETLGMVASEIIAFEAAFPGALTVDGIFMSNVLKWGYDPTGRTPWEQVKQLPAGHWIGDLLTPRRYWDWGRVHTSDDLEWELLEAVRNRTVADVPVGLLLSGGLDSSLIYKMMGTGVEVFHVENGEAEAAKRVLDGRPATGVVVNPPSVDDAVRAFQAPVDVGSLLPQLGLARAVSSAGFRVTVGGDGADELFGGYARAQSYDSQASDVFVELPFWHHPRLDRVMMSETIEHRSPYLAPRVVKYALGLPWERRTNKQALKEVARHYLPDDIVDQPKRPLKSNGPRTGGVEYRQKLIEVWNDQRNI